jgi:hypothetical protein
MTEPESFLSRWARRKQEAKHDSDAEGDAPSVERVQECGIDTPTPSAEAPGAEASGTEALGVEALGAEAKTEGQQEPQVDLSTLPPIESIGAGADIGAFLRKGVPLELTRAALRRAWTSDPAIRDFIGIAENQWDFATGSDIPGFGPLEASDDVRRMVAELFREKGSAAEPAPSASSQLQDQGAQTAINEENSATVAQSSAVPAPPDAAPQTTEPQAFEADNKEVNIATQQVHQQTDSGLPTKRLHGRALPQ